MKAISAGLRKKAQEIKLLLLDVDGVLTDGGIYIDDRGVESKRFDVRDGQGITLLKRAGIEVGFISGRLSGAVRYRASELGIKLIYQGVGEKAETYERIKKKTGLKDENIAYVGDDNNGYPDLAGGRVGNYGAKRLARSSPGRRLRDRSQGWTRSRARDFGTDNQHASSPKDLIVKY